MIILCGVFVYLLIGLLLVCLVRKIPTNDLTTYSTRTNGALVLIWPLFLFMMLVGLIFSAVGWFAHGLGKIVERF